MMKIDFSPLLRRYLTVGCFIPIVFVVTAVALWEGEPKIAPAEQPPADSGRPVGSADGAGHFDGAAIRGGAEQPVETTSELYRVFGTLSNRELLAIAQGGEVPEKLQALGDPDQIREGLLSELAKRLDQNPGGATVDSALIPPSASQAGKNTVEAQARDDGQPKSEQPPQPKLTSVIVEAVTGAPFSVGLVELKFEKGFGPTLHQDQPLFLNSSEQSIYYTAFDVSYQNENGLSQGQVDRVRLLFLLRGNQATKVSLTGLAGVELQAQPIRYHENSALHNTRLREWWKRFSVIPEDLDREHKLLKQSLLEMLARRLQLAGPWPSVQAMDSAKPSGLEGQFERAIGMLFGIESVNLAIQEDVSLSGSRPVEEANRAVPARPRLRSLVIPAVPASTRVESIAQHVPAECFYLRTGSLANYRYFRRFLQGWGGSLSDIVATRSFDRQTRAKLELQLGLDSEQVSVTDFDQLVSDMALIGCDPFFQDGAAIGVLFQARQSEKLLQQIQSMRQQSLKRVPGAIERRVNIDDHVVSLLASDDNRVRSFYAIDGKHHLVTNSEHLLRRFFQAGRGEQALGDLQEFRYARSKTDVQRDQLAFLYLSDPFFQNLVSPHYRIELTRRRRAAEELKQLQLARLVAKAEQLDAHTVAEFIEARLLPPEFARRPDKSIPLIEGGKLRDSLRGAAQAFLPVPDVPLDKVTWSEASSYQRFIQRYNQQWNRIDPVTVVFSRRDSEIADHDWVNLDIVVAPYAQNRYRFLRRHLAAANPSRVSPIAGDFLSLDTAVRTRPGAQSHLLYLGLRDAEAPFAFENGQVKLLNISKRTSYAKSHAFAALSPPNNEVLRLLASALEMQPKQRDPAPARGNRSNVPPPVVGQGPVSKTIFALGWALGSMSLKSVDVANYISSVETRDGWTVVSENQKIRQSTFSELREEFVEAAPQVRLRMGALRGAKVEPYIQAYTYLSARKVSAGNASFLNSFSQWLNLPAADARSVVENLLGARISCPLGGDFTYDQDASVASWVSTAWQEPSLYTVSETPKSWRFPFLDWIQRLNLEFDLGETTLQARVDLLINTSNRRAADGEIVGLHSLDAKEAIVVVNQGETTAVDRGPANEPSSVKRRGAEENARSRSPFQVSVESPQVMPVENRPNSDRQVDWVLGVRLVTTDESMRITQVYPSSPAARAGLRAKDRIQRVDRERPRSHARLVELLRAALERDGTAVLQVDRQGTLYKFEIPLAAR